MLTAEAIAELEKLLADVDPLPWHIGKPMTKPYWDFVTGLVNAAPDLLRLAEEALAAREWLKAWDKNTGAHYRFSPTACAEISDALAACREVYRATVAAHDAEQAEGEDKCST